MKIVAFDMGKSKSVSCVLEGNCPEGRFATLDTTPAAVRDAIERERPDVVVIEIGAQAGWMRDLCEEMSVKLQVANVNHDAWRWKNVKHKSDRGDALKLAQLSLMNQLPLVHVPKAAVRARRQLIAHRAALVKRRTMARNSIRATLCREAIEWPAGASGWSKGSMAKLAVMASEEGALWRKMLRQELEQLALLGSQIIEAERELDAVSEKDESVKLLRTIPGVGPRLAETLVAVIDDPNRFRNGKEVGCYAGLTPRRYQSGNMDRQGKISGQGHALLRSLLVEVAWLGRRWNPWMKGVYEKALKGSPSRKKIAIVALARRLLVVCWAMLRDKTPWRGAGEGELRLAA